MRRSLILLLVLFGIALESTASAGDFRDRRMYARTAAYPWHGPYYDAAWGMPVAVLVPPTAEFHTDWGWGVGNTRISTNWHQFRRNYPGPVVGYDPRSFLATPAWPSDTAQFGDYYVRGPW